MQKIGFAEALDSIVATDNRYSRKAYVFLRDALDYTTKRQKKTKGAITFGLWSIGCWFVFASVVLRCSPIAVGMTVIEVRPHRNDWKVFELLAFSLFV